MRQRPMKLIDAVSQDLPGVEMMPKQSPEDDHQANGAAEAAARGCKGQVRYLRAMLEAKSQKRAPKGEPILTWITRRALNRRSRYRPGGAMAKTRRGGGRPPMETAGDPFQRSRVLQTSAYSRGA